MANSMTNAFLDAAYKATLEGKASRAKNIKRAVRRLHDEHHAKPDKPEFQLSPEDMDSFLRSNPWEA